MGTAPLLNSRSCSIAVKLRPAAPARAIQLSVKCPPLGACGQLFINRAVPLSGARITQQNARRRSLRVFAVAGGVRKARPSHGYDYYELLGVGPAADAVQVKQAYRWLQKRCHPDVAGDQLGHDMAVLLNEAYSILSDEQLRAAYDQTRVMWIEDDAYTGQPLHSTWHGHPDEQQAVFVDETSCVGCLNCALIASETFAIENKYGRARCLRQWANDERTISDAIASCPVSCIHLVERQKLPALEYVMAQLPRHGVGVEVHSGGGLKRGNVDVFQATERFLTKRERRAKNGPVAEEETPAQKAARRRAAEAIQATQSLRGMDLSWFMGQQIDDRPRNRASDYRGAADSTTQALVWVSAKEAQAAAAASDWAKAYSSGGRETDRETVDYKYFGEGVLGEEEDRLRSDPLPYYAPDGVADVEGHRPSDALKALQEAAARRQGGAEEPRQSAEADGLEDEYWQAPKVRAPNPAERITPAGSVFEYSAAGQGVKRRVSFAKAHAMSNVVGQRVDTGARQGAESRAPEGVNSFQESLQRRAGSEWLSRVPALVALFQAVRVGLTFEEVAEATSFAAHELNPISEVMLAANTGMVPRMLFSGVAWYTIAAAGCALLAGALAVADETRVLNTKGETENDDNARSE
ncbi:hypothetical protein KFL_003400120 [Klebsormidium nitens]|uniref:J domain-containing protein n=1 Tax=Klebsormidium nitens TaxID=105231 RepID=A0A1Y1ICR6_KLENI|nr:hypothetical protein KFL_003400120 [Klebsormidium nitens]|eukprot:GAQ87239.1 hypothetical protein KFL_003400120 [Klebsormidium nitens]